MGLSARENPAACGRENGQRSACGAANARLLIPLLFPDYVRIRVLPCQFFIQLMLAYITFALGVPWRGGLSCCAQSQRSCLCPGPSGQRVSIP